MDTGTAFRQRDRLASVSRRVSIVAIAGMVGLVTMSAAMDAAYLVRVDALLVVASFWGAIAGVAVGFVAMIACLAHWFASPRGASSRGLSATISLGSLLVTSFAGVSWLLRDGSAVQPGVLGLLFCFMAAGVAIVAGVLAGELTGSSARDMRRDPAVSNVRRRRTSQVEATHAAEQVAAQA